MITALIVIGCLYALVAAGTFAYALFKSGIAQEVFETAVALFLLVLLCAAWPLFIHEIFRDDE